VTTTAAAAGTRRHTGIYPAEPRQVGLARAALAGWLGSCPQADEAILVASEFATNSVLYSASRDGGAFTLRAEVRLDRVQSRWKTAEGSGVAGPLTGSQLAARYAVIGAGFDAGDADVVCCQEVFTYWHLRLLVRRMRSFRQVSYRPAPAGPAGGLVTFSRRPVWCSRTAVVSSSTHCRTEPPIQRPSSPRACSIP